MFRSRSSATFLRLLLITVFVPGLASCGVLVPTACTQELGVEVRPRDQTLSVGREFTATATGVSCGGRQRFPYAVRWHSTDPAVAQVDSLSGRVRALSVGTARIQAHEPGTRHAFWGEVLVNVTP
jgi:uncharacterized protein (DUF58 family)